MEKGPSVPLKKTGYRFGSNQMNALHLIVLKCFVLQNTETEVLALGLSPVFFEKVYLWYDLQTRWALYFQYHGINSWVLVNVYRLHSIDESLA